jgi:hypothetical protein
MFPISTMKTHAKCIQENNTLEINLVSIKINLHIIWIVQKYQLKSWMF